jgi:hypothetical protein
MRFFVRITNFFLLALVMACIAPTLQAETYVCAMTLSKEPFTNETYRFERQSGHFLWHTPYTGKGLPDPVKFQILKDDEHDLVIARGGFLGSGQLVIIKKISPRFTHKRQGAIRFHDLHIDGSHAPMVGNCKTQ